MNKNIGKIAIAASVSGAIITGSVRMALEYKSGSVFHAADIDRELRNNQVLFPDDGSSAGSDGADGDGDSYWEDSDSGSDDNAGQGQSSNGYIFKEGKLAAIDDAPGGSNGDGTVGAADTVIDIVGDLDRVDTIIRGDTGIIALPGGNTSTLPSDNGSDTVPTPDPDPEPSPDPEPTPDDGNGGSYADSSKDPDSEKNLPNNGLPSDNYHDDVAPANPDVGNLEESGIFIGKPLLNSANTYLYLGQTVDTKTVFNALDTYVKGKDGRLYYWSTDAYDVYFRIIDVSFDGGQTYTELPTKIPLEPKDGTMKIRVEYRLKKDAEWSPLTVDYKLEVSRVLLLSETLKEENSVISNDIILNYDTYYQYIALGGYLNTMRYQSELLGKDRLTKLFPGWTEHGELVDPMYQITPGRHVLEPAELVDLPAEYNVSLEFKWMNTNYETDKSDSTSLSYLQTLCGYDGTAPSTLNVPKYIQAIDIDESNTLTVDNVVIPDTVLYIDTADTGLRVRSGYIVSENNRMYRSDNGVLLSKDGSQLLGIPLGYKGITIPDVVSKIVLPSANNLMRITLLADEADKLPTFDFSNVNRGCTFVLSDSILLDFITANRSVIEERGIYVASSSDPQTLYTVVGDTVVTSSGVIIHVLDTTSDTLYIPNGITGVASGALNGCGGMTAVVLPSGGAALSLENGWLGDSAVDTVLCYSEAQYKTAKTTVGDSVRVLMLSRSLEGHAYYTMSRDGSEYSVLVSAAPTVEFDGTVTAQDGSAVKIYAIGGYAFEDHSELKYVTLPESVKQISRSAFRNCTSLEYVLINSPDSIYFGANSFDGCSALRIIVSNALACTLEDGYSIRLSDNYSADNTYLFAPTGNIGYDGNWASFTPESGVEYYGVVEIGEIGRMIYGFNSNGEPWLALRSTAELDDYVSLPDSTLELWEYCMSDTHSPSGAYKLDLSNIYFMYIHVGAFQSSDLAGELTLPDIGYLGRYVFTGCAGLEAVNFGSLSMGGEINNSMFTGCDNLRRLTFSDYTPPTCAVDVYIPFRFNYHWTTEQEIELLKLEVPEYAVDDYVRAWRYAAAGYAGYGDRTAYQMMWEKIRSDNIDWSGPYYPTDDEVDDMLEEQLLEAENRVRRMLGLDTIDAVDSLYHFRVVDNMYITLVKTSPELTSITLGDTNIGLLDGWALDYIASGAFSRAKNLSNITTYSSLMGIYDGAFSGIESDTLTFSYLASEAPALLGFTEGTPFSFGIDDSRITFVVWGTKELITDTWLYPMAGYTDRDSMLAAVTAELGDGARAADINAVMEERLATARQRIDAMVTDLTEFIGNTDGTPVYRSIPATRIEKAYKSKDKYAGGRKEQK